MMSLVFTVEVVRVDGPDGKAAFSSEGFTENDQERLEKLLASVAGSE